MAITTPEAKIGGLRAVETRAKLKPASMSSVPQAGSCLSTDRLERSAEPNEVHFGFPERLKGDPGKGDM